MNSTEQKLRDAFEKSNVLKIEPTKVSYAYFRAGYLALLNSAEPVCIVGELSEPSRSNVIKNKGLLIGQYLYARPPAPSEVEWRCPVCNTDLKHEHAYNCMEAARSDNGY